jgi:hypothetical protein
MSQFMALYGYRPPSITSPLRGKVKVQSMEDHIEHQQEGSPIIEGQLGYSTK